MNFKLRITSVCLAFACLIVFTCGGWAETADDAKTRIEIIHADEMVYDGNAHTIVYTGSVHIVRSSMDLRADKIVLVLNEKETAIDHAYADGNVVVIDGTRRATAGHAEFKETDQEVVLTQNPHLFEEKNELIADKVIYDLSKRQMRAAGNVRGTFFPRPKKGE